MQVMRKSGRAAITWMCAVLEVALVLAACYAVPANKAGAPTEMLTTLTVANALGADEFLEVSKAVEMSSHGRLRLDPRTETSGKPDAEKAAIEEVRAGQADLGAVGARAFAAERVRSFDPLIAPFAVDSYDLQRAVLGDQALVDELGSGMDGVGLVSIGIVAGPMRYIASRAPVQRPTELAGKHVAISRSLVAADSFRQLGATTDEIAAGGSIDDFDAIEAHLQSIAGNGYDAAMPFITLNMAPWPRPIVLFMTRERYARLSPGDRGILRAAAAGSLETRIQQLKGAEDEDAAVLCRRGATFVIASPEGIEAMHTAVRPVLDAIAAASPDKTVLDRIDSIKRTATASTGRSRQCESASPSLITQTSELDGSWRACPTVQQIIDAGGQPDEAHGNAGCTTWTFRNGVFSELWPDGSHSDAGGSYQVTGDRITVRRSNGEEFLFRWSVFHGRLTFAKPGVPGAISPAPALAVPWERVGD